MCVDKDSLMRVETELSVIVLMVVRQFLWSPKYTENDILTFTSQTNQEKNVPRNKILWIRLIGKLALLRSLWKG